MHACIVYMHVHVCLHSVFIKGVFILLIIMPPKTEVQQPIASAKRIKET